jgi:predicted ribonuclease YlaK
MLLHGYAGTGKTLLALYQSYKDVFDPDTPYDKTLIVRIITPTQDIGALPGTVDEKIEPYEEPYKQITKFLFSDKSYHYGELKKNDLLEFMPISFVRGTTYDNTIIVVDECQNLDFHMLCSITTRVGYNSKIIFCGDFRQSDLRKHGEKNGIKKFMQILERMGGVTCFEFEKEDIVRSGFVKDFIIAQAEIEDECD